MNVDRIKNVLDLLDLKKTTAEIFRQTGVPRTTILRWKAHKDRGAVTIGTDGIQLGEKFFPYKDTEKEILAQADDNTLVLTSKTNTIRTLDDLLKATDVDLTIWEVERWIANKWDNVAKIESEQGELVATELWQVKAWLRRKKPEVRSLEMLLEEIAKASPKTPKLHKPLSKSKARRELEISIVDVHLGLQCFSPESQQDWNVEKCKQMVLEITERLIRDAEKFGPFERILLPLGNDLLHVDTVFGTTTKGTPQPESMSLHYIYLQAEKLGISVIDRLKQVAPVKVVVIPGNHDRVASFSLGRVWRAYYNKDKNVEVDAEPSSYKAHNFGTCLVMWEHGASINSNRMAALMANVTRTKGWSDARWCEVHMGDQHRKGSAKPSMMEEQGVSIEYLPGLTPPNAWSTLKGFSFQKRSGMAFVWDYAGGLIARLQVNVDNETGELM